MNTTYLFWDRRRTAVIGFRQWIRWLRAILVAGCGGFWFGRRRRATVVMALHRILEDAAMERTASLAGMLLRRRTFQQLVRCAASQYELVSLDALCSETSTRLRCALTFDDGWADNHAACLYVADEFSIPMTVFVCPESIGCVRPFWPERVAAAMKAARPETSESEIEPIVDRLKTCTATIRREALATLERRRTAGEEWQVVDRTLSWEQVREMEQAGIAFGSHSQTHQVLTAVADEVARHEIVESKQALEGALGKPCTMFAYPNGNHSSRTRELVAGAGFQMGFTTTCGAWTPETDPLAIPRIIISENDVTNPWGRFSPAMLHYALVWRSWRALKKGG